MLFPRFPAGNGGADTACLVLVEAASGLRSSELLALTTNHINFNAATIRVDESSDQRSNGMIGPCKNAPAYRTVVFHDYEGKTAMRELKRKQVSLLRVM